MPVREIAQCLYCSSPHSIQHGPFNQVLHRTSQAGSQLCASKELHRICGSQTLVLAAVQVGLWQPKQWPWQWCLLLLYPAEQCPEPHPGWPEMSIVSNNCREWGDFSRFQLIWSDRFYARVVYLQSSFAVQSLNFGWFLSHTVAVPFLREQTWLKKSKPRSMHSFRCNLTSCPKWYFCPLKQCFFSFISFEYCIITSVMVLAACFNVEIPALRINEVN